jgi:hypothetical protein
VGGRGEIISAGKKEKKRGERAHDDIASSFCYSSRWASHFTGPPSYVAPFQQKRQAHIPQKRGGARSRCSESKREREEREAETEVVVGEKRARSRNRSSVTLSKKGNFTLVIQVVPRSCSGHALVIPSQTGSQRDCECRKFNNDTVK